MLKNQFNLYEKNYLNIEEINEIVKIENSNFQYSPYNVNDIIEFKNSINHDLIFLKEKDIIIAYCIHSISIDEIDIYKIWVHKNYRKKGIAKNIINNISLNKNIKKIFSDVNVNNKGAISFYEKLGFEKIKIRKKYYNDNSDSITLLKKINQ